MAESVSSKSPRRNIGAMLQTQLRAFLHSETRMKYLELAFNLNSVYISDKQLYAERVIKQLNASPE